MALRKETSKYLEQRMREAVKAARQMSMPSFLDESVDKAIEILAKSEDTLKEFLCLQALSVTSMLLGRKTDICLR